MRPLAALLPSLLLLAPAAAQGGGWEPLYQVDGAHPGAVLGDGLGMLDDLDGDGQSDLLVSAPYEDAAAGAAAGVVRVLSGADGSELRRHEGSFAGANFGTGIAVVGDLDGDGSRDYCIQRPMEDLAGAPASSGHVAAYSGATGLELWNSPGRSSWGGFGDCISGEGDLSGDGIPDVLVAEPFGDRGAQIDTGLVVCLSGDDGRELFQKYGYAGTYYGMQARVLEDVNGDGLDDFAISAPWETGWYLESGAVYVYHGDPAGAFLAGPAYTISHAWNWARTGTWLRALPDADADGAGDFALHHDDPAVAGDGFTVHSGATGAVLCRPDWWTWSVPPAIASAGDLDGDGRPDLVAASGAEGELHFFDPLTGAQGSVVLLPDAARSSAMSLAGGDDLDGDSFPDLAVASPWHPVSGSNAGQLLVLGRDTYFHPSALSVSVAAGGGIQYDLAFPADAAGDRYRLLASASGTQSTGLPGGVTVNLTLDNWLAMTWLGQYPGAVQGGAGLLDGAATATATITIPPGALSSAMIGQVFHLAAACEPGTGLFRYASLSVPLEFLP